MSRLNFSNVTIVLSVKVDCAERIRNLGLCLDFYACFCSDHEIIVVEQDIESHLREMLRKYENVHHHFIQSRDVHWKTRNYNVGAKISERRVLLMADCDIFPHPEGLAEAQHLSSNGSDFVQVYNGVAVDVHQALIEKGIRFPEFVNDLVYFSPEQSSQQSDNKYFKPLYGNLRWLATGGGILCRRKKYFSIGGYNENLVSFGFEDQEFFVRGERLGGGVRRVDGYNVYHLQHPRLSDSIYGTYYRTNETEYERVCAMSDDALQEYADRGFRSIRFDHDHEFELVAGERRWGWEKRCRNKLSIDDTTILVLTRAVVLTQGQLRLLRATDYLESNFDNYDLLVTGTSANHDRFGSSKKHLRYTSAEYEHPDDEITISLALQETNRRYVYILDLNQPECVEQMFTVFDRLLAGGRTVDLLEPRTCFEHSRFQVNL